MCNKDVFNTNEDALTETILNFRNVQVVLGKEYITIRAGQPKSKQHMHVKWDYITFDCCLFSD